MDFRNKVTTNTGKNSNSKLLKFDQRKENITDPPIVVGIKNY